MKYSIKALIQWFIDKVKSHEQQAEAIVADFKKVHDKFEALGDRIEKKIAEEKAEIAKLEESIAQSAALSVKNARIRQNFKVLLGEA